MRFRIQTEDGTSVQWEQDGPFVVSRPSYVAQSADAVLWLSDAEAQELCLELAYQIMRIRHPERGLPE